MMYMYCSTCMCEPVTSWFDSIAFYRHVPVVGRFQADTSMASASSSSTLSPDGGAIGAETPRRCAWRDIFDCNALPGLVSIPTGPRAEKAVRGQTLRKGDALCGDCTVR